MEMTPAQIAEARKLARENRLNSRPDRLCASSWRTLVLRVSSLAAARTLGANRKIGLHRLPISTSAMLFDGFGRAPEAESG